MQGNESIEDVKLKIVMKRKEVKGVRSKDSEKTLGACMSLSLK